MMQAASDIYLGWTKGLDMRRNFCWRQSRGKKGSALVEGMIRSRWRSKVSQRSETDDC